MRDRNTGPTYRKNNRIRVPEVRLVDEGGEQLGVVATPDARRRAQEAGLDLVEVSPNARPPVCKIMDYGKFMYQQRKKEKKNKTSVKGSSQLKELRVRPAIDTHDLEYRLDNGRRFLDGGHKVQVVCIFRGRQMAHPEHGYEVMRTVADSLSDIGKVETSARMMGRRMTMLLTPLSIQQKQRVAKDRADAARAEAAIAGPATPSSTQANTRPVLPDPSPMPRKPASGEAAPSAEPAPQPPADSDSSAGADS